MWKMRTQIVAEGRDPDSVLIFNLFTPIVGRTEKEAEEKLARFESYVNFEGGYAV